MIDDETSRSEPAPDVADVVEGPVGSAHLKVPTTSGPMDADLRGLRPIDIAPDDIPPVDLTGPDGSIEGPGTPGDRQERDRIRPDLELTRPVGGTRLG